MTDDALSTEELQAILAHTENGEEDNLDNEIDDLRTEPGSTASTIDNPVNVSPVKEKNKSNKDDNKDIIPQQQKNVQLLLDIYMQITVELGRTKYKIKEILSWGEGAIIELGKPATEYVNLLVNKRLIAKGEVVVIDENFGVRVTDIVDPKERLMTLT